MSTRHISIISDIVKEMKYGKILIANLTPIDRENMGISFYEDDTGTKYVLTTDIDRFIDDILRIGDMPEMTQSRIYGDLLYHTSSSPEHLDQLLRDDPSLECIVRG